MVGEILNSYKIVKKISEGGMGEVYLAEHKFLDRKAAVKVLHQSHTGNKDIKERFLLEAQTLSRLDHPYIVKIFDFDEYKKSFYIIMEYIEGNTLEEYTRVKKGLMPEIIAKDFFIKVLSAVDYAHSNNVIHRDIKPSNIMINEDHDPVILDFGIARLLDSDRRVTKANTKMGSLLYMSPEQILGQETDLRSDIYSLGITLYETLTAKHPYDIFGDTDYILQTKIIKEYPPPPNVYYPMISKQIEYVISKAINKDPLGRFSSCVEFSQALSDPYFTSTYLFSDEPVPAEVSIPENELFPNPSFPDNLEKSNENEIIKDNVYSSIGNKSEKDNNKTKIGDLNTGKKETGNEKDFISVLSTDKKNEIKKKPFYEKLEFRIVLILILVIAGSLYFIIKPEKKIEEVIIKADTNKPKTNYPPPVIEEDKSQDKKQNNKQQSNTKKKKAPVRNPINSGNSKTEKQEPLKKRRTTFE